MNLNQTAGIHDSVMLQMMDNKERSDKDAVYNEYCAFMYNLPIPSEADLRVITMETGTSLSDIYYNLIQETQNYVDSTPEPSERDPVSPVGIPLFTLSNEEPMKVSREARKSSAKSITRRREQNRASQRAFRERKQQYIKDLEGELEDLRNDHSRLQKLSEEQRDAISRLRDEVLTLSAEVFSRV
ncbi:hypothetical protein F5884DRAFT_902182 [Xylogone sp. PMI_703]|nr:hypothetical protein F5884DRAFT_902182 [Xylogone sp. PMI_703]